MSAASVSGLYLGYALYNATTAAHIDASRHWMNVALALAVGVACLVQELRQR